MRPINGYLETTNLDSYRRLPKKRAVFNPDEKDRNPRFRRPMNNGSIYMPKCYE
jgi:hypothetical protein